MITNLFGPLKFYCTSLAETSPYIPSRLLRISAGLAEGKGEGLGPVKMFKSQSNLFLTIPKRYFCCGSSMSYGFQQ